MNKQLTLSFNISKQNTFKKVFLLFVLIIYIIFINSCKKEILNAEAVPKEPKPKSSVIATSIPYSSFLKSVDINSLGVLKGTFNRVSNGGILSLDNNNTLDLGIYTDSVKKFVDSAGTSYVFKMKLASPRAIVFRNLTVFVSKNGVKSAFIATYSPSQAWIRSYKLKKASAFDGKVDFSSINLNANNLIDGLSLNSNSKQKNTGNGVKYVVTVCQTYRIFTQVFYGCSDGNHYEWDPECVWNTNPESVPDGEFRGGHYWISSNQTDCWEENVPDPQPGGGGGTTPNPPGGYDPCDTEQPPIQSSIKKNNKVGILVVPPPPCDGEPPFNENEEIILPANWDMEFEEDWLSYEDEYAVSGALIAQHISGRADPIPEMYYLNGVGINMSPATPRNGTTVFGAPRNNQYFWKELVKIKPQMFDASNRSLIKAGIAPVINDQWLKYNPTHVNFKGQKLIHHHESQGNIAYAIPKTVHEKWSRILHQYRTTGKLPRIGGKALSLFSIGANVASFFTGWLTGDPGAWSNWYAGNKNEIGKIYYHADKDCYWQITNKIETKVNGVVTRAIVTYDVFEDYIWDSDEKMYMGVLKLGTFTEDIDVINKTSRDATFAKL